MILVSFESSQSGERDAGNKYAIVFFNEIENFISETVNQIQWLA